MLATHGAYRIWQYCKLFDYFVRALRQGTHDIDAEVSTRFANAMMASQLGITG